MNTTEVRFYHLERYSFDHALPVLLSKALKGAHRVVVKTTGVEECEEVSRILWTEHPNSFIPHGTQKDGNASDQPIWITYTDENPNGADVLVLVKGVESMMQSDFSLCCDLFNGRYPESVKAARVRWRAYKEQGYALTYWQQGTSGWEKKAG